MKTAITLILGSAVLVMCYSIVAAEPEESGKNNSAKTDDKTVSIKCIREKVVCEIEFKEAKLDEVVSYLSKECKVNIVMHPAAKELIDRQENLLPPVDIEDGAGTTAPQKGDITIRLVDVPLKEVLRYILRMKGLKYIVEDYAIVIVPMNYVSEEEMETEIFRLNTSGTTGGFGF